jgi:hypothetical protein
MNGRQGLLFSVAFGVLALVQGCDGKRESAGESRSSLLSTPQAVATTRILMGRITPAELSRGAANFDPPYDRPETAASAQIRDWSLRAQALADSDSEHFYVMGMDTVTGDVFAVARSRSEAEAHAAMLAPKGIASASADTPDVQVTKSAALSDYLDNRTDVSSSSYDSLWYVQTAGLLGTPYGQGSGSLFASYWVITVAHAAIPTTPGTTTIDFAPRARSVTDFPYGVGHTTYVEWELAFTNLNCHTHWMNDPCAQYDLALVHFSSGAFSTTAYNGFTAISDSSFTSQLNAHVGYPRCLGGSCSVIHPAADFNCADRHPIVLGASSSNYWPYNDGSNPTFRAGCDYDEGQSGGSLLDKTNHYILGVFSVYGCQDPNCLFTTQGPRINQPIFNWMLSHR